MEHWELIAREQVRDTVAAYNHSGDRFLLDELAACFTVDGVLESKGDWAARGRAEIVRTLSGVRATEPVAAAAGAAADARRPSFVRHFLTNLRFEEVTPERIRTSAYFAVLTAAGLDHWGRYRDVLVPAEGRWLFAHRVVRTDAMVPDSPFQRRD
ncbi:nuclear transport factor 2 family protein [Frankia sp. AgB1.9]|uniref:nuclear transport factor 2 family protein n=1 Tax=Frankia sp. AgB1.9 TaxID=1836968 RepID=UPI0019325B46|nr:nuclear transport factor 2 family protein [Frankia sp. AgB1.9]MBL7553285.1 nuclear transport factor 2 family protein [Frankia sp. AgB1.9]